MNGSNSRWVGIDVAKSKLDVALLDERGKIKNHVFPNDAKGHLALTAWLHDRAGAPGGVHVCMEATGPYGEAVATTLVDAGFMVSVVNPARIKGFAQSELSRKKSDQADAALLARFCQTMRPKPWLAPSIEVRELRALVDRLQHLKEVHQQEANRLESAMNQASMRASIEGHMQWLQVGIKELERQIDDHIDRHPVRRQPADHQHSWRGRYNGRKGAGLPGGRAALQEWQGTGGIHRCDAPIENLWQFSPGTQFDQPKWSCRNAALPVHARDGGAQTQSSGERIWSSLESRWPSPQSGDLGLHAQTCTADLRNSQIRGAIQPKIWCAEA